MAINRIIFGCLFVSLALTLGNGNKAFAQTNEEGIEPESCESSDCGTGEPESNLAPNESPTEASNPPETPGEEGNNNPGEEGIDPFNVSSAAPAKFPPMAICDCNAVDSMGNVQTVNEVVESGGDCAAAVEENPDLDEYTPLDCSQRQIPPPENPNNLAVDGDASSAAGDV